MSTRAKTTDPGALSVDRAQRRWHGSPHPSTRSTTLVVTALSLAAAGTITGGLAVQMAAGHDPALSDEPSEAEPMGRVESAQPAQPSTVSGTAQVAPDPPPAPTPTPVVTRTS